MTCLTPSQEQEIPGAFLRSINSGSNYAEANTGNLAELLYLISGVGGESGEVVAEQQKLLRYSYDANYLRTELRTRLVKVAYESGDVLWYVTRLVTAMMGISMEELMLLNIVKLYTRHAQDELEEVIPWPLKSLAFPDALKLTQHIEYRIMEASASIFTATVTSSKPTFVGQSTS